MESHEQSGPADAGEGGKPAGEEEGEHGLGTKTGGVGGPDDRDTSSGGDRPAGGEAEDGPVKSEESEPGGGGPTGPTPDGVPQEGGNEPDPDTATGSTGSGPNPAEDE